MGAFQGLTIDDAIRKAPAILNRASHPWTSKLFAPVATVDVLDKMVERGYVISRASQVGKEPYGFHVVAFRMPGDVIIGDAVPELVLTNAANGSAAFRVGLGLFRLICANGLVLGKTFMSYDVNHKQDAAIRCLEAADKVADQLPALTAWQAEMESIPTTLEWNEKYARRAAAIRWLAPNSVETEARNVENSNRLLDARRIADVKDNVWSVYNRVQENIIRGGRVVTLGATGRRTVSKAITSTAEDMRINTRLFDLTNEMADELRKAA